MRNDESTGTIVRYGLSRPIVIIAFGTALALAGCHSSSASRPGPRVPPPSQASELFRAEAELAYGASGEGLDEFPPELQSELSEGITASLDVGGMLDELEKALSERDPEMAQRSAAWWNSEAGGRVAAVEADMYRFLQGTSNRMPPPAAPFSSTAAELINDVAAASGYLPFVPALLATTADAQLCLRVAVSAAPKSDCVAAQIARRGWMSPFPPQASPTARMFYAALAPADLTAYRDYLHSPHAQADQERLHSAEIRIIGRSWESATGSTAAKVDGYVASTYGTDVSADALARVTRSIDEGLDLRGARMQLLMQSRRSPRNPNIYMQLARVTVKLAPSTSPYTGPAHEPQLERSSVDSAERYIDQALGIDANNPDFWMLKGHIAYLQHRNEESIALLEKAVALGGQSPWLHVNLGDALWSHAAQLRDGTEMASRRRAAEEFELAQKQPGSTAAAQHAVIQLANLYAELNEMDRAESAFRRSIAGLSGPDRAYEQHRYAMFRFQSLHDTDGALAAIRAAVQTCQFEVGERYLVKMLAVKAGELVASGNARAAAPYLQEARELEPDLQSLYPELARFSGYFLGIVGIHSLDPAQSLATLQGGQALVYASLYATRVQVDQLLSWGADPNYFDAEEGAPLHMAIAANNLDVVKTLLAHGADPNKPFLDGRTPSELTSEPSDRKRADILTFVRKAARTPAGSSRKAAHETSSR